VPNKPFCRSKREVENMTSATLVLAQCREPLGQLVLELKPEKGVKGALAAIASEAGLSYSKVRRMHYGLTEHVLAYERDRLRAAIDAISARQEQLIEKRLQRIRELRRDREDLEKQIGLRF
jgi:hypothetical protein